MLGWFVCPEKGYLFVVLGTISQSEAAELKGLNIEHVKVCGLQKCGWCRIKDRMISECYIMHDNHRHPGLNKHAWKDRTMEHDIQRLS